MRERSTTGVERVPPSKNLGVATNCRVAHRSRGGVAVDVTGSAGRLKMRLPKKAYRIVKGRLLPAWSLASVQLLIRFCRLLPCCQQVNPPLYPNAISSIVRFEAASRMPLALARARSAISRPCSSLALRRRKWAIGACGFRWQADT
jgi:hypothetical protein